MRFLIVGGWNTAFSYFLFIAFYRLLGDRIHYSLNLTLVYIISITTAYFCYKFLVFKTRGNYLREYLRFYLVYATAFLMNMALLPIFVEIIKINPVIAQGIIVFITAIVSYVGHKNFSFSTVKNELE